MTSIELTSADLESILKFTVQLAKTAGKLILEGSQAIQSASDDNVNEKKNAVDLVTEYDVKVEELVKKEIKARYPDFKLYVVRFIFWDFWLTGTIKYWRRVILCW